MENAYAGLKEKAPFKIVEVNGNNVVNGEGAWIRHVNVPPI